MSHKIGRNEPCLCGSGKKYKNCCMSKNNNTKYIENEDVLNTYYNDEETIEKYSIISTHNIFSGIKEYVLGSLEQLIYHLKNKYNIDYFIKYKCQQILDLLNGGEKVYLEQIYDIAKKFNFQQSEIDKLRHINKDDHIYNELNCMERILIRNTINSTLMGYVIDTKIDYGATRILLEGCYRAIRGNSIINKLISFYDIYVTKEDILIEWKCDFESGKQLESKINEKDIIVNALWNNVNKCKKELKVIDKLYGLREESLKKIYLILSENTVKKLSKKEIIHDYIDIISTEYNFLFNLIENKIGEKKLLFEKLYSIMINSKALSDRHKQMLDRLNTVILEYNNTNDYDKILIEINKTLYDDKLLLILSNDICKFKKNYNLDYFLKSSKLPQNTETFNNLKDSQHTTIFDLKNCISTMNTCLDEKSLKRIDNKGIGLFGYYDDRVSMKAPKTSYGFDKGLKELLLGEFEQLEELFESEKPNRYLIDFIIEDINNFTNISCKSDLEILKEKYIKEATNTIDLKNINLHRRLAIKKSIESNSKKLTELDFIIFRCVNCCITKISDIYTKIVKNEEVYYNYNLYKTLRNVSVQLLQQDQEYILNNIYSPSIQVYIDGNGNFVEFTIIEQIENFKAEYKYPIINCINIDNLNYEETDYIKNVYSLLTDKGRIFFSTSEEVHRKLQIIHSEKFDYSTYCLGYLKCIEQELKDKIGDLIKENIDAIHPKLTLGSFGWAFHNYREKIEEILNKKITDEFVSNLNYIIKVRNDADHTEIISINVYESLRKIIIDDGFLRDILDLKNIKKVVYDINKKEMNKFYEKLDDIILEVDEKQQPLQKPELTNHYDRINLLNITSYIFFNCSVKLFNDILLQNRIITSEIDSDKLGCLLIKDDINKRQGIFGVQYDYVGYDNKKYEIKLLFRSNVYQKHIEIPGYFNIIYEDDKIVISPSEGAKKLRKYLYRSLYDTKEFDINIKKDIYIEAMKRYINVSLESLNKKNSKYNNIIKSLVLSKDIWSTFDKKVIQSFNIIKQIMITTIVKGISIKEKEILIKSCRYIVDNFDENSLGEKEFLYLYATIYVDKIGRILNIDFENVQDDNDSLDFMFEIVTK